MNGFINETSTEPLSIGDWDAEVVRALSEFELKSSDRAIVRNLEAIAYERRYELSRRVTGEISKAMRSAYDR